VAATAARSERTEQQDIDVLIVGAGFGGVAAAIELRRAGFEHVRILEKAPELGGTWYYNSYPGAACDVPSHLYSFSFAQRRDWSRLCSPQAEIHEYLLGVAREHHVQELVETGVEVTSCTWQQDACRWQVATHDGRTYTAAALIVATGQLHQPAIPKLPDIDTFAGHSFHSAAWDHEYAFSGRRVAVVGTGASAVQFVPEIAPLTEHLTVFQRTGNWFLPRKTRPYTAAWRWAVRTVPGLQDFRRRFVFEYGESLTAAIRHPRTFGRFYASRSAAFMRKQLQDPEIRRRAWPDYTFGCKRILFSSDYLSTLQRENVDLVTEPLTGVAPQGLLTGAGHLHEVECIVWATGFRTNDFMFPMEIRGADGHSLREDWARGAHAHLGITVPGYPNMFVLYGPNTNTSGGSIIFYLETQCAYVRQALQQLRARGAGALQVRTEVEAASDRELQARFAGTAWMECDSWYRDEHGRIIANWPGYMREYSQRVRELDAADFDFMPAPVPAAVPGASSNGAGSANGASAADTADAVPDGAATVVPHGAAEPAPDGAADAPAREGADA
jgi:cation diffusion facilitator CzcD-associated flavoprotein CzcO